MFNGREDTKHRKRCVVNVIRNRERDTEKVCVCVLEGLQKFNATSSTYNACNKRVTSNCAICVHLASFCDRFSVLSVIFFFFFSLTFSLLSSRVLIFTARFFLQVTSRPHGTIDRFISHLNTDHTHTHLYIYIHIQIRQILIESDTFCRKHVGIFNSVNSGRD